MKEVPERIYREVGLRIRALRLRRKLTLEQLGEASGLHPSYIGLIERNVKKCSLRTVNLIAKGLKVPIRKLFP